MASWVGVLPEGRFSGLFIPFNTMNCRGRPTLQRMVDVVVNRAGCQHGCFLGKLCLRDADSVAALPFASRSSSVLQRIPETCGAPWCVMVGQPPRTSWAAYISLPVTASSSTPVKTPTPLPYEHPGCGGRFVRRPPGMRLSIGVQTRVYDCEGNRIPRSA
jgi:hypothetical protein